MASSSELRSSSELAQSVKNPPAKQETQVRSLDQENPLEEGMATQSSIVALENSMDKGV